MWSPYTKTSRLFWNSFPFLGKDNPDLGNENDAIVFNTMLYYFILYILIRYYILSQSDLTIQATLKGFFFFQYLL